MQRNLFLELLEEHDKVCLYSPRFEGETATEFEKFLMTYSESHPSDLQQLVYRLDVITREGIDDRYFRYEGKRSDNVIALPSHLETTSLRLYCLNLRYKVLILGNGGIKETATYQEDAHLNQCVETLQKIDIEIRRYEKQQIITIKGSKLVGELTFTIND
ncbi:MAG: hypothetical protein KBS70_04370 [Bacteroidales bacterium]|nr:hypothetical protein [Candidatus Colicola equi]